jgi:hypothetical protein
VVVGSNPALPLCTKARADAPSGEEVRGIRLGANPSEAVTRLPQTSNHTWEALTSGRLDQDGAMRMRSQVRLPERSATASEANMVRAPVASDRPEAETPRKMSADNRTPATELSCK